jgi:hypothetical protein
MIITDRFVFVHQPKTGGTFVAEVLERIHKARLGTGFVAALRWKCGGAPGYFDTRTTTGKHANCLDIPDAHRDKPIVSIVRSPYDRLVSRFEFRWWESHPHHDVDQVRQWYPNYPDLTFDQFVDLGYNRGPSHASKFPHPELLGPETRQFIHFFFRKPRETFAAVSDDYIAAQRYLDDMFPVRFLRTRQLNADLHAFLTDQGYAPSEIAFVRDAPKVLPGKKDGRKGKSWQEYFSPDLKQLVRDREKLLFAMFPDFDV